MTHDRTSPWEALKALHEDAKESELPELQRSSDIMWDVWEEFDKGPARTNMRMFVTLSISNKITLSLIRRALDMVKKDLTPTPIRFNMDSDPGKALLSTVTPAHYSAILD